MSDPAFVEQSALGMLRNCGPEAAARAEALSGRFARKQDVEAAQLWSAIAREIRRFAGVEPDARSV